MRKKVLILTGNYGEGHTQVAQALNDAINIRFPELKPVICDLMESVHPHFNQVSRFLFLQGVKKFPMIYGYLFQKTRRMNPLTKIMKTMFSSGVGGTLKLIEEIQPTVIVSTFPLAAAVMSKIKEYGVTNIPTVTIITDHTDHSCWIYPHTDQYIVGSNEVRNLLIQLGVKEERIADTGIPIRPQFSQECKREEITEKYGLMPNMPTVLVMGGGLGLIGNGNAIIKKLEALPQPVQFVFVCGHNNKLFMQLKERLKGSKHCYHLTGYIHYVHELMAISNLMITKPGGVTTFEAIAMELPMLLYKPIPGQEQDNVKFLVHSGVAIDAENYSDLTEGLSDLLNHPERLQEMRENSKKFHPKESSFASLDVIVNTIAENNSLLEYSYSIGS
ncbi:glycosyltransferase [Bacillus sp. MUM 13]|uniref:MGDG synthase family glycosyltransferase n=1 Tax=Bacillus sp. MUM 13 TaxID=1678001 RepID=UPI000AB596B4|nr:glycosyltransferase [Bacillus sp. MUM 13]